MDVRRAPQVQTFPGSGMMAVEGERDIPPICVIAATDRPGKLVTAFKSRFSHSIEFTFYDINEMITIVRLRAAEKNILLSPGAARMVAATCHGVQLACQAANVELLQRIFACRKISEIRTHHIRDFLNQIGVDELGISLLMRRHLETLESAGANGLRLRNIAAVLGTVDGLQLQKDVEPPLLPLWFYPY